MKRIETLDTKIYIGSNYRYTNVRFSFSQLKDAIAEFQKGLPESERLAVRITHTHFVFCDYSEAGYEIGVNNYVRKPVIVGKFMEFVDKLSGYLLHRFNQERIYIVNKESSWMIENDKFKKDE